MTEPKFWVIGMANTAEPWLLNLDGGYASTERAQRAINWQRIGQGQFDPPEYWKIVTTDELKALIPTMSRDPYTQQAWEKFIDQMDRSAA